jgi:hypothetical protein
MPQARLPVVERIARKIFAALGDVTPAAGYTNSFTVRRRGTRGNAPTAEQIGPGKVFAVLIQPSPQKIDDESHPFVGWMQPFWVDLYVYSDEDASEALDSKINSARADCSKAMCNNDRRTWDALAIDTTEEAPIPFEGPGTLHGIQCRFTIQYRHVFYDPSQAEIDT